MFFIDENDLVIQAFILAVEFSTQSGKFLLEAYVYKSSLSMSLFAANNFLLRLCTL